MSDFTATTGGNLIPSTDLGRAIYRGLLVASARLAAPALMDGTRPVGEVRLSPVVGEPDGDGWCEASASIVDGSIADGFRFAPPAEDDPLGILGGVSGTVKIGVGLGPDGRVRFRGDFGRGLGVETWGHLPDLDVAAFDPRLLEAGEAR